MTITYRDSTQSLTATVTKPTGTVNGDLVLLFAYNVNSVNVPSLAGWTTIFSRALTSSYIAVLGKIASGEGASWTLSNTAAVQASTYAGAAIPTQQSNAAADATGNVVTTTSMWLVDVYFTWNTSGSVPAHGTPSGYTSREMQTEVFSSGNIRMSLYDTNGYVAAGTKNVTNSTTSTIKGSGLIALPDAVEAADTTKMFAMF